MLNRLLKVIIVVLIFANVILIAESLLDMKTDKIFDVYENIDAKYIYKK